MKRFISNGQTIYDRVTNESPTHYICGNKLYAKADVITDHHPLDELGNKLYLHIVPFYNY
jgi:hypothetical protein